VLYFPRLRRECNVIRALGRRFKTALRMLDELPPTTDVAISTQSSTSLPNIPDGCVDYIFTDPPFGQNIIYSEVNFLWESWMGVTTSQEPEAIVSRRQRKGIGEYRDLMERCFSEFRRILKPGGWMTVEFHNSNNEVWAAIQSALQDAGFEVRDVRILDKQQISFKQASTENAVQKDLAISARKPGAVRVPVAAAQATGGTEQDVWRFVQERLEELGAGAPSQEQTAHMLFARMVQRWLQQGWRLPMTAERFYQGLKERFVEREGLYGLV
jgi:adenine-specific DNA methylase